MTANAPTPTPTFENIRPGAGDSESSLGFGLKEIFAFGFIPTVTKHIEGFLGKLDNVSKVLRTISKTEKALSKSMTGNMKPALKGLEKELKKIKKEFPKLDELKQTDKAFINLGKQFNLTSLELINLRNAFDTNYKSIAPMKNIILGIATALGAAIVAYSQFEDSLITINKELIVSNKQFSAMGTTVIIAANTLAIANSEIVEIIKSLASYGFGLDVINGKNIEFIETIHKTSYLIGVSNDEMAKYAQTLRRGGMGISEINVALKDMTTAFMAIAQVTATTRSELMKITSEFTQLGITLGQSSKQAQAYGIEMAKVHAIFADFIGTNNATSFMNAIEGITKGTIEGMKSAALLAGTTVQQFKSMNAEGQLKAIIDQIASYGDMNYLIAQKIASSAGISADALMAMHSQIKRIGKEEVLNQMSNKFGLIESSVTDVDEVWQKFMSTWTKSKAQLIQSLKSIGIVFGSVIVPILKLILIPLGWVAKNLSIMIAKLNDVTTKFAGALLGSAGLIIAIWGLSKAFGYLIGKLTGVVFLGIGKGVGKFFEGLKDGFQKFAEVDWLDIGKGLLVLGATVLAIYMMSIALKNFEEVGTDGLEGMFYAIILLTGAVLGLGILMSSGYGTALMVVGIAALFALSGAMLLMAMSAALMKKGAEGFADSLDHVVKASLKFSSNIDVIKGVSQGLRDVVDDITETSINILDIVKMGVLSAFFSSLSNLNLSGMKDFGTGLKELAMGIRLFNGIITKESFGPGSPFFEFVLFATKGNLFGLVDSNLKEAGNAVQALTGIKAFVDGLNSLITTLVFLPSWEAQAVAGAKSLKNIITALVTIEDDTMGKMGKRLLSRPLYEMVDIVTGNSGESKLLGKLGKQMKFMDKFKDFSLGLRGFIDTLIVLPMLGGLATTGAKTLKTILNSLLEDDVLENFVDTLDDVELKEFSNFSAGLLTFAKTITLLSNLEPEMGTNGGKGLAAFVNAIAADAGNFEIAANAMTIMAKPLVQFSDSMVGLMMASNMLSGSKKEINDVIQLINSITGGTIDTDMTMRIAGQTESANIIVDALNANTTILGIISKQVLGLKSTPGSLIAKMP